MMHINKLVQNIAEILVGHQQCCSVAESCTGGMLASYMTDLAGSSHWFERGFVTYSNAAKHEMLGVPLEIIKVEGAVSEAVVMHMAKGALNASPADFSVAISGIAGPGGGSVDKPVGTVWIAWQGGKNNGLARRYLFSGDRQAVRILSVEAALQGFLDYLKHDGG